MRFFHKKKIPPPKKSFAGFLENLELPFKKIWNYVPELGAPKKEQTFSNSASFPAKNKCGNPEKFGPNCHPYVHAFLPSEVESTPVLFKI